MGNEALKTGSQNESNHEAFDHGSIDDMFRDELEQRQRTIERLQAELEGKYFSYGTHFGTFNEMVILCPAFGGFVDQGYEYALEIISSQEITEEEYQELLNPTVQEDDDKDKPSPDADILDETPEKADLSKTTPQKEKVQESPRPETSRDFDVFKTAAKLEQAEDSEGRRGVAVDSDVDLGKGIRSEVLSAPKAEDLIGAVIPEIDIRTVDVAVKSDVLDDEIEVLESEIVHEDTPATHGGEAASTPDTEVIELDDSAVTRSEATSRFDAYIEVPSYDGREGAIQHNDIVKEVDAFHIPNAYLLDETPAIDLAAAKPEVGEVSVDETAPGEFSVETLPTVVQQVFEREELSTTDEEKQTEIAVTRIVETVSEFVKEEPEYEAELTIPEFNRRVVAIEQAISSLEKATTKEECQQYVEEIKKSLAELLDALGYEGAELMAERLIHQYDMKTLRQFIIALLKTLSPGEFAPRATSGGVASVKHQWLGQHVVERLVNALPLHRAVYAK